MWPSEAREQLGRLIKRQLYISHFLQVEGNSSLGYYKRDECQSDTMAKKQQFKKFHQDIPKLLGILIFLVITSLSIVYLRSVINAYLAPQKLSDEQIKKITTATLTTNFGEITIKLTKENTATKTNFVNLVHSDFYSGLRFHRIVPDFGIQTGDPLSRNAAKIAQWGSGSAGYTLDQETHTEDVIKKGTVVMAADGNRTHSSQFIIITKDSPWLVGHNTILGEVVSGMDVVESISHVAAGVTGIPSEEITLLSIHLK